jgi:hypothetical protein
VKETAFDIQIRDKLVEPGIYVFVQGKIDSSWEKYILPGRIKLIPGEMRSRRDKHISPGRYCFLPGRDGFGAGFTGL